MIFNELNEDNFLLFAIKHYENPQAVTKEDFDRDLNHFKYLQINRKFNRFHKYLNSNLIHHIDTMHHLRFPYKNLIYLN